MLPEPAAVQAPPPEPAQVQLQVSEAGKASATVTEGASLGPALEAVIVYVVVPPAVTADTPSVLVTERSACGESVSVSVAVLLPADGSVTPPGAETVAVFESEPDADAETLHEATKVTEPPEGRFTEAPTFPDPVAGQEPPPAPEQVQLQASAAGKVSETVAPVTLLGPALEAVTV
jgi:hypothetical protein